MLPVVARHILIKSLVATADLDHGVVSFQLTILPVWSNQIELVPDIDDRNGEMLLVDNLSNLLVEIVTSSWPKGHRCLLEQLVTLLLKLLLAYLVFVKLGHEVLTTLLLTLLL